MQDGITHARFSDGVQHAYGQDANCYIHPKEKTKPIITMEDNGDYDLTCPDCGRNAYYSVNYLPKFCENCGVEFDYD